MFTSFYKITQTNDTIYSKIRNRQFAVLIFSAEKITVNVYDHNLKVKQRNDYI